MTGSGCMSPLAAGSHGSETQTAISKGKGTSTAYENDANDPHSIKRSHFEATGSEKRLPLRKMDGTRERRQRDGRTVSKLSPEQRARKRANDREAQRSLRQRTREHIENLERRLDVLSRHGTGNNSEHLRRVQQRNRELMEALEHARASLAQMQVHTRTNFQTHSHVGAQAQVAKAASQYVQTADSTGYGVASFAAPAAGGSVEGDQQSSIDLTNYDLFNTQLFDLQNTTCKMDPEHSDTYMDERDGGSRAYWTELPWAALQAMEDMGGPSFAPGRTRFGSGDDMAYTNGAGLFSSIPGYTMGAMDSRGFFSVEQQHAASSLPMSIPAPPPPVWARIPLYYTSTNPVDILLKDAMDTQWASGLPLPTNPDYSVLFAPIKPQSKTQLLNDALVKAIRLCACDTIAAEAALLYISHIMWSWYIWPSPASYARLPVYMRPVRRQLEIPHPHWSDTVFFPLLRDRMMTHQERFMTTEFIISFTESFGIRWPSGAEGNARIFTMSENGWLGLTPEFEAAVRDFSCWTMSSKFFRRYPETKELVQVHLRTLE